MRGLVGISLLGLVASTGCVVMFNELDLSPELGPLEETTLAGQGKDRIVVIDISGEISSEESRPGLGLGPGESMVSLVRAQLEKAGSHPRTRALVLRIDSPGGSVAASDQIYREITSFRERHDVPVYAVLMGVAASGGYYVAMAANEVYAQPTTITGSIGVITFHVNVEGLMHKIGIQSTALKSGEWKDLGSPLGPLDPEEQRILQSIIDQLFDRFVDVVEEGRPSLSREAIVRAADGRIYTAREAKELGLVDEIGYLPEVLDALKRKLGFEEARVVMYHRPHQHVSNIYSRLSYPAPKGLSLVDPKLVEGLIGTRRTEGFYYLWEPGGA